MCVYVTHIFPGGDLGFGSSFPIGRWYFGWSFPIGSEREMITKW